MRLLAAFCESLADLMGVNRMKIVQNRSRAMMDTNTHILPKIPHLIDNISLILFRLYVLMTRGLEV
jgi:hypothetical protein